ncbi:MAG: type II toxin-antitoxin system RelE/ParE family toxin [Spirochaetaceae bacterium]|nr:type II toxin-antitoxin system RelE/ParE family toxin [Spirochaetaceae bacterium]
MRVFKNTWFTRFAAREAISDDELKGIVNQLEAGQAGVGLGGGVYKVRISRPGAGKSGGYRVIVFFRRGERIFYVYGFAKSDMGNISDKQLKDFKTTAKITLAYTDEQLDKLVKTNWFVEI